MTSLALVSSVTSPDNMAAQSTNDVLSILGIWTTDKLHYAHSSRWLCNQPPDSCPLAPSKSVRFAIAAPWRPGIHKVGIVWLSDLSQAYELQVTHTYTEFCHKLWCLVRQPRRTSQGSLVLSCPCRRCKQNWRQAKTVGDRKCRNCFVQFRMRWRLKQSRLVSNYIHNTDKTRQDKTTLSVVWTRH